MQSFLKEQELQYFIINKPFGVLSQFTPDPAGNKSLKDLNLPVGTDVYPVGRLDKDSEGILILSNDKYLVNSLLNPKYKHKRTYLVQIENIPDPKEVKRLEKGIQIKPKDEIINTEPCTITLMDKDFQMPERNPPIRKRENIPTSWASITLTEGKFHQVRKMFAAIGCPVLRLIRISIEDLKLGDLKPGHYMSLNKFSLYRKLKIQIRTRRT